jgi:hypothetical protein
MRTVLDSIKQPLALQVPAIENAFKGRLHLLRPAIQNDFSNFKLPLAVVYKLPYYRENVRSLSFANSAVMYNINPGNM